MNDSVFRKASLDRLSSPDHLDQLLRITKPKTWIAVLCTVILMASALLWALTGEIVTTITARGILVCPQGMVALTVSADGTVEELFVRPGDRVQKGAHLARIRPDASPSVPCFVTSTTDGVVLDLFAQPLSTVKAGSPLANLSALGKPEEGIDAILYVPATENRIRSGMEAEVYLALQPGGSTVSVHAVITDIAPLPSTRNSMIHETGNPILADSLGKNGPLTRISARLDSSDIPPQLALYSGTMCSARIMIDRATPFAVLFPVSGRSSPR